MHVTSSAPAILGSSTMFFEIKYAETSMKAASRQKTTRSLPKTRKDAMLTVRPKPIAIKHNHLLKSAFKNQQRKANNGKITK
jgi:hypothetical protein